MASKPEMALKFCAQAQLGALIEFVALALDATVGKFRVGGLAASFVCEQISGDGTFTITVTKSGQRSADDFQAEVAMLLCALHMLSVSSLQATGFSKNVRVDELMTWLDSRKFVPTHGAIDERTNLTQGDLQQIWQVLALSEQPLAVMLDDPEISAIFPYADMVAGSYTSLRHQSGCEISPQTRKDGTLISHRVDAPNPVRPIFRAWQEIASSVSVSSSSFSVKANLAQGKVEHSIYNPDGYRGTDESRWRISKLLGAAPPEHKCRVFSWAADAINTFDEFHNTRGGVRLPDTFACSYDDVHLTADCKLRFSKR